MKLASKITVLILLALITLIYAQKSKYKLLWLDESFDTARTCSQPYGELLSVGGKSQCSPHPFFHIIQKATVGLIGEVNTNYLIKLRTVSIISMLVVLAAFIYVFFSISPTYAFVALSVLTGNIFITHYATEARPYMFWVMLFALALFLFSAISVKKWSAVNSTQKLALLLVAFLIAGVASPSMGQIVVFVFFSIMLSQFVFVLEDKQNLKTRAMFYSFISFVAIAVGMYYTLRGQSCKGMASTSPWSLVKTLAAGDISLLLGVARVLIPKGGMATFFFHGLMLLGLLFPFLAWKRRKEFTTAERVFFSLSFHSWGQLLFVLPLIVSVYMMDYFLVWRGFLFLVVLRAVLVTVGVFALIYLWKQVKSKIQVPPKLLMLVQLDKIYIVLTVLFVSLVIFRTYKMYDDYPKEFPWKNLPKQNCEELNRELFFYSPEGNSAYPAAYAINYAIRISEEASRCESTYSDQVGYIMGKKLQSAAKDFSPLADNWYELKLQAPEASQGWQRMVVCGQDLRLTAGSSP